MFKLATKLILLSFHWRNEKWPNTWGCVIIRLIQYIKMKRDLIISTGFFLTKIESLPSLFLHSVLQRCGKDFTILKVFRFLFPSQNILRKKLSYFTFITSQMLKKNLIFLTLPNTSTKFDLLSLWLNLSFHFIKCKTGKKMDPSSQDQHRLNEILHISPA